MDDNQRGHTDKQLLVQGLKRLALGLPLLLLTTYAFTFTFLNKDTIPMYYILPLALLGMAATIYTLFSGIKLIMKSLFK
jgi:hypothetical protein